MSDETTPAAARSVEFQNESKCPDCEGFGWFVPVTCLSCDGTGKAKPECRYCGMDADGLDAMGRPACETHIEEVADDLGIA